VPLPREVLAELNQRSDAWGLAQTLGHLGIIALTGALAWYAAVHWGWLALIGCLFLHGTVYAFLLNGFHELCHSTVFKTRSLNRFFLYLISFMGGLNYVYFWASHQEHHKYTLHQPDDMEVILPVEITLKSFWRTAFINPVGFVMRWKSWILLSLGHLENDWQRTLFPDNKPARRRELINWTRILLAGHLLLIAQAFFTGWWMLPVLITVAPFYGELLLFLCNNTQHVGLQDEVEDFRLCTRTIYLNPDRTISLLAHELPHRASYVCRCAVLSAGAPAPGHPARIATDAQWPARNLARDHSHPAPAAARTGVPIHPRAANARPGAATTHEVIRARDGLSALSGAATRQQCPGLPTAPRRGLLRPWLAVSAPPCDGPAAHTMGGQRMIMLRDCVDGAVRNRITAPTMSRQPSTAF